VARTHEPAPVACSPVRRFELWKRCTSVPAKEDLSWKVVGLDVYNNADQDIGKIKDIAFNARGVNDYIVGGSEASLAWATITLRCARP
jgi:hypothetical protein